MIRKSYVLSRAWAWISKIQWRPRIEIPIPRALSQREFAE